MVASNIQAQVSITQLACLSQLADDATRLLAPPTPPPTPPPIPRRRTVSFSDRSDTDDLFFDAREEESEIAEPSGGAASTESKSGGSGGGGEDAPTCRRARVETGVWVLTLFDDTQARGTPLLQLAAHPDGIAQLQDGGEGGEAGRATVAAWLAVYYFRPHRTRDEPCGWEPIIEMTRLGVAVEGAARTLDVGTRGSAEICISPQFMEAAQALAARLPAVLEGSGERRAAPFAPFQLYNDTGTPLAYDPDGAPPTTTLAPGQAAALPGLTGGRVCFVGFDGLEVRRHGLNGRHSTFSRSVTHPLVLPPLPPSPSQKY
jgi:hypothetical protein